MASSKKKTVKKTAPKPKAKAAPLAVVVPDVQPGALAEYGGYTKAQVQLIKTQVLESRASDDELRFFCNWAKRMGMDPFGRQVTAKWQWKKSEQREVLIPMVTIDGMRSKAQASGVYRGGTPYRFTDGTACRMCSGKGFGMATGSMVRCSACEGSALHWVDVWLSDKPPVAAKVGVYRDKWVEPMVGIARYASYVQTNRENKPTGWWKNGPEHMLGKCAEALALRRAFPDELGGAYVPEEMSHADVATGDKDINTQPRPTPMQPVDTVTGYEAGEITRFEELIDGAQAKAKEAGIKWTERLSEIASALADNTTAEAVRKHLRGKWGLAMREASLHEQSEPTVHDGNTFALAEAGGPCVACGKPAGEKHADGCPEDPNADKLPEADPAQGTVDF